MIYFKKTDGFCTFEDIREMLVGQRKVDIRLRGKENSHSHVARPVY